MLRPSGAKRLLPPAQRRAATRSAIALRLGTLRIERAFARDVAGIMRGIHATMMAFLTPAIRATTADSVGVPTGKAGADIDKVLRTVMPQIGPKVSAAHAKMSAGLIRNYKSTMKAVLPIGFSTIPNNVRSEATIAREASIALVENAARAYAQSVRDVFGDPSVTLGMRWEDLRDKLLERGDVSESRAELIARDQTLKLNGAINKASQEGIGITSYSWSTSGDERVRDEHAELDGEIFDWSSPPSVGAPGEDFQCRCIGIPVIPTDGDD